MTLNSLIDEARKLNHAEQSTLLDELLRLVGPEAADTDLTPAQAEDLDSRLAEYDSGRATLIAGDVAIGRLRQRD